jgi:hypothetical protein
MDGDVGASFASEKYRLFDQLLSEVKSGEFAVTEAVQRDTHTASAAAGL